MLWLCSVLDLDMDLPIDTLEKDSPDFGVADTLLVIVFVLLVVADPADATLLPAYDMLPGASPFHFAMIVAPRVRLDMTRLRVGVTVRLLAASDVLGGAVTDPRAFS